MDACGKDVARGVEMRRGSATGADGCVMDRHGAHMAEGRAPRGFEVTYVRGGHAWRFASPDGDVSGMSQAVAEAASDPSNPLDWFEAWLLFRAIEGIAERPDGCIRE